MSKFNVGDRVVLKRGMGGLVGHQEKLSHDKVYTVVSTDISMPQFVCISIKDDYGTLIVNCLEKRFERFEMSTEEYIVWCPDSKLPPTVRFKSKDRAVEVAKKMASQNTAQRFYVCKLCVYAESPKPETQVVDL